MIFGSVGSKTTGVVQLRRSETVAPKELDELPPLVERLHAPYWEHAYTLFWLVGSIRTVVPWPPPIAFHDEVPHERSEPLSCAPPPAAPPAGGGGGCAYPVELVDRQARRVGPGAGQHAAVLRPVDAAVV